MKGVYEKEFKKSGGEELNFKDYEESQTEIVKLMNDAKKCKLFEKITIDGCKKIECLETQIQVDKRCESCPKHERPRPNTKNGLNFTQCGPDSCKGREYMTPDGYCKNCPITKRLTKDKK